MNSLPSNSLSDPSSPQFSARNAEFWKSAPSTEVASTEGMFEIAIVGRSNVGKSSLINRLCQKRKLARTSGTPGSTQSLVLYRAELVSDGEAQEVLPICIVDLPGFGFAKRSKKVQRGLSRMISEYVQCQESLQVLCLLNDIRRDAEEEELQLLEILRTREIASLLVLTKCDKLSHSEKGKRVKALAEQYRLSPSDLIVTGEGEPPAKFWGRVALLYHALSMPEPAL